MVDEAGVVAPTETPVDAPAPNADAAPATPDPAITAGQDAAASEAPTEGAVEPTDAPVEGFAIPTPEGMESYGSDFESYSSDVDGWLAENPNASASDALKWVADRQVKMVQDQMAGAEEAQQVELTKRIGEWADEVRADPEIGGSNYEKNAAIARSGIEAFADPEMKMLLEATGFGSHPAFVKYAYKVGRKLADPGVVLGGDAPARKSLTSALYGS